MTGAVVYRQAGRFAGWPANYGLWAWGDEVVVGFTVGAHKTVERGHARDKSRPFISSTCRRAVWTAGAVWQTEPFAGDLPGGRGLSADEHMQPGLRLADVMYANTATAAATAAGLHASRFPP